MKTQFKFYHTVLILLLCLVLFSCKKPEEETPDDLTFDIWVLNEGLWNMNNSSITAYNTSTKDKIGDIYKHANSNRQLGDVANDILVYGSKVYVIVNTSSQINVMDKNTGISMKQISVLNNGSTSQPRYAASHNGKIYVSCFDGSIVKIDTASLQIEATATAGRNPEGVCIANNKLYVSNSGGLDFPNYDNTVSVFDLSSFTEIKKIEVRMNPTSAKADKNGNVYIVSNGNYENIFPCIQRINSTTDQIEKIFDITISGFDIYNDYIYFYTQNYSNGNVSYQIFDVLQDSIINKNFISEGSLPKTPNGININPYNGDVYISDALDYTSTGDVYCFDKNGKKKFQFEAGIIPKKTIFK